MEISFLENGIHSLQKGFEAFKDYEEGLYIKNSKKKNDKFYNLKDAILSTQHGVEILIKYILFKSNEMLIFSQIDAKVKQAFKEKRDKKLSSVFKSSVSSSIHTISFKEAIERIKFIVGIELSDKLIEKLLLLEAYRNQIMHSEIYFNEIEINTLFDGLLDEIDVLFYSSIGNEYKTLNGYKSLKESFDIIENYLKKNKQELKLDVTKCFMNIFENIKIGIGNNEVKRFTDIDKISIIFERLFNSKFAFGADLYNGYCSGNIKSIERINKSNYFTIYAQDIDSKYTFKIRSLIIYIPSIISNNSPQLYIEIDQDEGRIKKNKSNISKDVNNILYYRELIIPDKNIVLKNEEEINNFFYADYNYDDEYIKPYYYYHYYFLTAGIFCFINVQGLNYGNIKNILYNSVNVDGKYFEVNLRESLILKSK